MTDQPPNSPQHGAVDRDDADYVDPNANVPYDETLEWEGRPAWRIRWREDFSLVQAGLGLIGTVFTLVWLSIAPVSMLWTSLALLILAACVYLVALRPLGQAWLRARTDYAVTDQAVYMVTRALGIIRRHRIPYVDMTTPPRIRDTDPPSLIFGEEDEVLFTFGNGLDAYRHTRRKEFGFLFIDDAPRLQRKIAARTFGERL